MDFWDLTKLIFRRWYVSVPLFLVAIGATFFVAVRVEPDYVSTSYVQLVGPKVTPKAIDDKKATARNPWLDLGLASLAKAGVISVQDQKVVEGLKDQGYSDDFTVTQDQQQPIITFEVIGDTEVQATRTSQALVDRLSDSITKLQQEYGAPSDQMITARRLDLGDNVKESTSKVKRALIAVGAVGILLAAALTVAVDVWLRRRKRRGEEPIPGGPVSGSAGTSGSRAGGIGFPARAAAAVGAKKGASKPVTVRTGGEYSSSSSTQTEHPEEGPNDETKVLKLPPGEETIVLPGPTWQARTNNGTANGSKRP